jgi:hypothetical protein
MNTSGNKSFFINSMSGLQKINKLFVNTLNNITSFELSNLSGSTSNLQLQIDNISSGNATQVIINENAISALQNRAYDDEQNIIALETKTTNMSYDGTNTIFNDNVIVYSLNGISNTIISYLSNVSSDIQTQLNSLPTNSSFTSINSSIAAIQQTLSNMVYSNNTTTFNDNLYVNGNLTTSGTINGLSNTLLQYLTGLTGNI